MPIDSTSPVGGARAIAPLDARLLQRSGGPRAQAQPASTDGSVVVASEARDVGPVPIDNDRVAEIRKAVESGTYPLVPAKVADAIIAAGMLLRSPK